MDNWVLRTTWPHVACPVCGDGYLAPEALKTEQSAASARAQDHEAWEPEWITGIFHGTLRCGMPLCAEPVVVADTSAGDALMAVKWIGNEGSHADALTATDVIDGAELLGHALRLLYDDSAAELERRIKKINKSR